MALTSKISFNVDASSAGPLSIGHISLVLLLHKNGGGQAEKRLQKGKSAFCSFGSPSPRLWQAGPVRSSCLWRAEPSVEFCSQVFVDMGNIIFDIICLEPAGALAWPAYMISKSQYTKIYIFRCIKNSLSLWRLVWTSGSFIAMPSEYLFGLFGYY